MFSERGMFAIFLKMYPGSKTDFFVIFLVMIIIIKREP